MRRLAREHAGDLHDLRPAVARRALADGAALHASAASALERARARRRALADARAPRRRRARRCWRPRASRASRASSPSAWTRRYEPGRRSGDWLKVKNVQPPGARDRRLAAGQGPRAASDRRAAARRLRRADGALRYAGRVGTGFDERRARAPRRAARAAARATTRPFDRRRQPPRGAHFVEPRAGRRGRVHASGRASGILRHPSYKGLREDKAAERGRARAHRRRRAPAREQPRRRRRRGAAATLARCATPGARRRRDRGRGPRAEAVEPRQGALPRRPASPRAR